MNKYMYSVWKFIDNPWNVSDVGCEQVAQSKCPEEMFNLKELLETSDDCVGRETWYDIRVEKI